MLVALDSMNRSLCFLVLPLGLFGIRCAFWFWAGPLRMDCVGVLSLVGWALALVVCGCVLFVGLII